MSNLKTPARIAVEPLLVDAEKAAEQYANKVIANVMKDLAANDWDLQKCAPWPHNLPYGTPEYHTAVSKQKLYHSLVRDDDSVYRSYCLGAPHIVKADPEAQKRFVDEARRNAALQYESFILKLETKIGSHSAAVLDGSHVWGYSILTVTTPEGVQRWKTQTIINVSKLGKLFNQYPTRKVK